MAHSPGLEHDIALVDRPIGVTPAAAARSHPTDSAVLREIYL